MPQHLRIEVEDKLVARLTTYNKGGTRYDITLCVPELGTDILLSDVDTREQRRPEDVNAQQEDFQNDFTHARRCIAAAFKSSDKFLEHLQEHGSQEFAEMKPIMMRLMTNNFDRGCIQVQPTDNDCVNVKVFVGVGLSRVQGAYPQDRWEWTCEDIDASGMASHTERALVVLRSIGQTLLLALSSEIVDQ